MVQTIDRLKQLIPAPVEPLYPGSKTEWKAFEKKVGLRFPDEYFTLANTYGSGRFLAGEFKVANPFDPDDQDFAGFELTRLHDCAPSYPNGRLPYPLFPEPGGLYPFGIDDNGNTFLWLTNGDRFEWPIACLDDTDYSELVNFSLIEFVVRMATNQLGIKREQFWGNDITEDMLTFEPRRPRRSRGRKSNK